MIALSPDLYQPEPWAQQHAEKTYVIMFDNNKNKKWRIIARIEKDNCGILPRYFRHLHTRVPRFLVPITHSHLNSTYFYG